MDLFVYYRVPAELAASLQPRVQAMQQQLKSRWSVTPSLKRRPEEKAGFQTWMEIYTQVSGDFLPALDHAVNDAGLMELIDGERHVETFVDVAACA